MGKKATGGGEPRELIPARTYLGVVIGAFDIGTQKGYGDNGSVNKFIVQFELHYRGTRKSPPKPALDSKGEAFTLSKFVSFYLGSRERASDLLKLVEAAERRQLSADEIKAGYDVEDLLGKVVQVQVINEVPKGKTELVAKVASVLPLDPDEEEPESEADTHYFEIAEGSRDIPSFVPKFVADWIGKSKEFGGDVGASSGNAGANGKAPRQPVGAASGGAAKGGEEEDDDDDIPF